MPVVTHLRVQQGYRPWTNPRRAMLGAIGVSAPVCLDQSQNSIDCLDPECTYGDCGASAPSPAVAASGIPTGGYVSYTGQWITTATKNANDIIQAVISALPAQGLRVSNLSTSAGMLANTKILGVAEAGQAFSVTLQLQVTGSGFAQASDVASIVDHFVYTASGKMPLSSSAGYQPSSNAGGGGPPPVGSTDLKTWFEDNAVWIGLGVVAAFVLPKVL